jgi:general stress protein YciG
MTKRKWNGFGLSIEGSIKGGKTAWASDPQKMLEGAKAGGKISGNKIRVCPNCAREIKGNSGYGQHLKKCNAQLDK